MSFTVVETSSVDNLITGITHRVTETSLDLTASSGVLARGTVMALNTVTGLLVPYVLGGADGAAVFYGILGADYIDNAAVQSVVTYKSGQFNQAAIIFSGAGAVSDIKDDARLKGVYLEVVGNNDVVV